MGGAQILKIDHSDVSGSVNSWLDLFVIHQRMKKLELGVDHNINWEDWETSC